MVIGVVYNAQCVSSILKKDREPCRVKTMSERALNSLLGVSVVLPYRLGESQANQCSVKEACAQNVERVEADRVPHTHMRSQLLPGKNTHKRGQRGILSV